MNHTGCASHAGTAGTSSTADCIRSVCWVVTVAQLEANASASRCCNASSLASEHNQTPAKNLCSPGVVGVRSALCDLVGIEVPIIQAGMSIFTSPALAAAVSDVGALGSLGAWNRPTDQLRRDLAELRDLTERPFAVNHVVPDLNADAFAVTLELCPSVVSFALDDAGADFISRAHDAGGLVMQQITTVQQAQLAVEHGADIVVAQGGEAGGYGGTVSTLSLVPQVVDAVSPVPVVAAGGIADGRGIAAAVILGAAGVNLGSRFLASAESPIGERWKKALVTYPSEDWIQAGFINAMNPNPGTLGYGTRLRLLRTEFVERWEERTSEVEVDPTPVMTELGEAVAAGDKEALLVVGGQSAGLIRRIEPAGAIVRRARRRDARSAGRGRDLRALGRSRRTRRSRAMLKRVDGAATLDRPPQVRGPEPRDVARGNARNALRARSQRPPVSAVFAATAMNGGSPRQRALDTIRRYQNPRLQNQGADPFIPSRKQRRGRTSGQMG